MRRVVMLALFLATAAAIAVLSFWCGRVSVTGTLLPVDRDGYETLQEVTRFEALVKRIRQYVETHDGQIPIDPYRGLVEAGTVESFFEFIFSGNVVSFDFNELPPMINPSLEQNARAPFFYVDMRTIEETWVCYLDGTWSRERWPGITCVTHSEFGKLMIAWRAAFHGAGYPYWGSLKEKAEWFDREKANMHWDGTLRMYRPVPKTAQTAPESR